MDDNNFNGASYKDLQLEDQINQALSGYNSIARKISDLKKDIISKPKNKNKYLNYKYIQNSPLLPKKREDIFVNRNNETFFGRNNLIEEFKDTLEKSQIIKDDLLRSTFRSSTRKKNNNSKTNLSLNKTPITYKSNYLKPINRGYATSRINKNDINNILSSLDDDEDIEDNNSNGGLNYNIPNGQHINNKKYSNKFRKIKNNNLINKKELYENNILEYDKNDKKKLELSRNTIINTYQKIKKENRILEVEINNYKKLSNKYLNFGGNYSLKDNNFSQNTFNSYKQSFQQTIQNNCRIIDLILNTQKQS
jgi:ribosomal protein L35